MKRTKRLSSTVILFILAIGMVMASFSVMAYAASSPLLSIDGKTVNQGDEFTVAVEIQNAANKVYNGNFTLQYDSSKMEIMSYTYGSIFNDHTKNCNLNYQSTGNQIRFTFSGAYALKQDGTLVTFTFKAKETASGASNLQFTAYKLYDENGSSLGGNATGATVDVVVKATDKPEPPKDPTTTKPTTSNTTTTKPTTSNTTTTKPTTSNTTTTKPSTTVTTNPTTSGKVTTTVKPTDPETHTPKTGDTGVSLAVAAVVGAMAIAGVTIISKKRIDD